MTVPVETLRDVQPTRRRVVTLGGPGKRSGHKKPVPAPETTVKFKNAQSAKTLVGTLIEGPERRTVILCHGFSSHRDGFHLPAIAQALAKRNVGSLRFDFSGNGDSEGTFQFGNYAEEAEDIRAAVQFLRARGHNVTAIVGHSKGANAALLYASIHDDVPAIVNIAGRFDLKRGLTERFGPDIQARLAQEKQIPMEQSRDDGVVVEWMLTKWSFQDRLDTDMAAAARKIRCAEVLTLHGTKDRVTPVEDAREWGALIRNHTLKIIDGADHSFLMPIFSDQMIMAIVERCTL